MIKFWIFDGKYKILMKILVAIKIDFVDVFDEIGEFLVFLIQFRSKKDYF